MPTSLGPRAVRVYEALREVLIQGGLAPGAKLPATARLAADFGVAPMTARSALQRLEEEGLIALELGRGTFARAPAPPVVLVVDEEPEVLRVLGDHVARAGFRPVPAGGPDAALALLRDERGIALVMTGLRMPTAADGTAFVRAVHRRWPSLPVAVVTGYPDDLAELLAVADAPVLVVAKPFRFRTVEQALRLALRVTVASRPDADHPPPAQAPAQTVRPDRVTEAAVRHN